MTRPERLTGRVAVLHDMAEEGWPSMDQMGRLLTTRLPVSPLSEGTRAG